jgi:TRAP transporter TAXI family solute receptor
VNVGSRDSGTRATWDAIQTELGWRGADQVHPMELQMGASVSALCSGAIDATLMIVGHPSFAVTAQRTACPVQFVAVGGPAIAKLLHDHPYYERGAIGAADGLATEVPTFGVRATLVTSASVNAHVVAVVAQEILTHLPELRTMLPTFGSLTLSEMIEDGLSAPVHPGATLVYRELEEHE